MNLDNPEGISRMPLLSCVNKTSELTAKDLSGYTVDVPLRSKLLIAAAMAALLAGVAWLGLGSMRTEKPSNQEPPASEPASLTGLHLQVLRCELGTQRYQAIVKVYIKAGNVGAQTVRLGPGSFWLLDAHGMPYLDQYAAEQPNAEPIQVKPYEPEREIAMRFQIPATSLGGSLTLLVGPAATGNPVGSPPPAHPMAVSLKEDGPPKGPFIEGNWKTFTGTKWN